MATVGRLAIILTANGQQFSATLKKSRGELDAFVGGAKGGMSGNIAAMAVLGASAAAAASFIDTLASAFTAVGTAAMQAARFFVTSAADLETLTVSFETLLGSAEQGSALMARIVDLAARTPLQTLEIADATKQLLAMNFGANETLEWMQRLGDMAGALNKPIGDLAYLLGTTRAEGKLLSKDMRQFRSRGIGLDAEIAKGLGVPLATISQMIEAGKITAKMAEDALKKMTDAGGLYHKGMERQSKTVWGLWSTLKDNIILGAAGIGNALIAGLDIKAGMESLIRFTQLVGNEFVPIFVDGLKSIAKTFEQAFSFLKPAESDFESILASAKAAVGVIFSIGEALLRAGGIALQFWQYLTGPMNWQNLIKQLLITEWTFRNWGDIVDLALSKAALAIVTFASDVAYFFTGRIPQALNAMMTAWQQTFNGMAHDATVIFTNLFGNLARLLLNIPSLLKDPAAAFAELWRPLGQGLSKIPKFDAELMFPPREMNAAEKHFKDRLVGLQGMLGANWLAFRDKRMKELFDHPEFKAPQLLDDKKPPPDLGGAAGVKFAEIAVAGSSADISARAKFAAEGRMEQEKENHAKKSVLLLEKLHEDMLQMLREMRAKAPIIQAFG